MPKRAAKVEGFTLIELMIAVAILVILLVVAVPSLQSFIQENKQKVTRDLLANSLMVAQQEAIRSNLSTYVCPTSSGTSCEAAWGANIGWLVFRDDDRNATLSDPSQIIASYPKSKAAKINFSATGSSSPLLRFFPTGHALAGVLTVCAPSNDYQDQRISVTRMGRIEYAAPSNNYCP